MKFLTVDFIPVEQLVLWERALLELAVDLLVVEQVEQLLEED